MKTMRSTSSSRRPNAGRSSELTPSALSDDDSDEDVPFEEGLSLGSVSDHHRRKVPFSGPFSALHPAICPDNASEMSKEDNVDFRWDEFGFKVEHEDGPEQTSSKILSQPFSEDPQHRLKWIAHLEFTHNQVVQDLTWDKVDAVLPKSEKLGQMVLAGVPHSLRPHIWPRLCGALVKQAEATYSYEDLVNQVNEHKQKSSVLKQIEKDLLRTMPTNVCFMSAKSTGVPKLRRILRAIAFLYPDIGYCQGTGVICASLLLLLDEESAFWMVCSIIEDLLPASYYSENLLGLQADQRVLRQVTGSYLPEVERVLRDNDIELSLISLHWFLTLFASVLHPKVYIRLWDVFFYEGTSTLFRVTLAMLKLREGELKALSSSGPNSSADIFNMLSRLPGSMEDADMLFDAASRVAGSVTEPLIQSLRKKQLAILMADQGLLINVDSTDEINLPRQTVHKRKLQRSKSFGLFQGGSTINMSTRNRLVSLSSSAWSLAAGTNDDDNDPRTKNVKQTELLIDLREAIVNIARHFIAVDPSVHTNIELNPDFSAASHSRDHERFVSGRRTGLKRARALLDFERQDDDELGFRKNDVITIVSEKDEHCWIGELNGLRGWFPAKFVQVLDERGKLYSALGDDAVTDTVTDLVRGGLCTTLLAILEHGIKRSRVLGSQPCHPWLFIERVAQLEVQRDFYSVQSRLRLCKTFKLDEDGKVLTPEELLYRAVQHINASHDPVRTPMDVKFRSLVTIGLNEQALHLWWELLSCCEGQQELRRKWYHAWSFVRSPAWVQIKCELRVLAQFSFNLNPEWEVPHLARQRSKSSIMSMFEKRPSRSFINGSSDADAAALQQPLKDGVKDMLVKHHLFSWDL